ncbi:Uncharacterised protein [Mycobacteroides abscessus subsp. abscessus]|nr:Uncharacterised protein [Mycobacteroides abscessus subsp. abscessus]
MSTRRSTTAVSAGRSRGATTSSTAITGTLIKNTDPHQKCSSSRPETIGPTATPPASTAFHAAIALARSASSRKMWRINASVDGMSVAPDTASTARARISSEAVGAKAARIDAPLNPTAPIISKRRCPTRSASEPIVNSRPANTNP